MDLSLISLEKLKDQRWYVEAPIFSYSHIITDEAFNYWNNMCDHMKMKRVDVHNFILCYSLPELDNDNSLYTRATMMAIIQTVALNVGAFGHFWWHPPTWPFRYSKLYDLKNKTNVSIQIKKEKDERLHERELTKEGMIRIAQVFSILAKLDEEYFHLYSRATTLMGSSNLEYHFYTEAFSNYFRLMERFINVEILLKRGGELKVQKMKKELLKLNVGDVIVEEFHNLYTVRCRDAMHARGEEKQLTYEEAAKCKIICDLMLYKFSEQRFKNLFIKSVPST